MEQLGYRLERRGKDMRIIPNNGKQKPRRLRSLCEGYTEQDIEYRISVTWMKDAEELSQTVAARTPVEDVDYTIVFAEDTGWLKGSDGYWYYSIPVSADDNTGILITQCQMKEGVSAPEGYRLSVEIIASAIQASPNAVVTAQWGVTLDGDRIISAEKSEVTGE